MRHFLKIADNVDVLPLLLALKANPQLWNQHPIRKTFPSSPHNEMDDILLRFNDVSEYEATGDPSTIVDGHESVNYPAFSALPQSRALIFGLMSRVEGERLGRCMITRMAPGHQIKPHVDAGENALYYERFHIVLESHPEALFRTGDEVVQMAPGECWWFNNGIEHECWNEGTTDRTHLIVDIHTAFLGEK